MKPKLEQEMTSTKSRKYRVRIRTTSAEFEGLFYSPHPERRLSEVLSRAEQYINLKDVKDVATNETFSFMVISKTSIETVKVLQEYM